MDLLFNVLIYCEMGEICCFGEYYFILLEILVKNVDVVLLWFYLCVEVWKNCIVGGNSLLMVIYVLCVVIDDDGK